MSQRDQRVKEQRESERLKSQECQKVFSSEDLSSEDKTYERFIFMKISWKIYFQKNVFPEKVTFPQKVSFPEACSLRVGWLGFVTEVPKESGIDSVATLGSHFFRLYFNWYILIVIKTMTAFFIIADFSNIMMKVATR